MHRSVELTEIHVIPNASSSASYSLTTISFQINHHTEATMSYKINVSLGTKLQAKITGQDPEQVQMQKDQRVSCLPFDITTGSLSTVVTGRCDDAYLS